MTERINNLSNRLGKIQIGIATILLFLYPCIGFLQMFLHVEPPAVWVDHMVVLMYVGAFALLPKQLLGVYRLWHEIKNGQNSPENENIGFKIQKDEQ